MAMASNLIHPQSTSERVIDVASWVGVGAIGVVLVSGILFTAFYAFRFSGLYGFKLVIADGAMTIGMTFMEWAALGAFWTLMAGFGTLMVAVFVAAIAGGVARWRSRMQIDTSDA